MGGRAELTLYFNLVLVALASATSS
jgi:hypothetical protein